MKSFRFRLLQQALPFLLVLPATVQAQQMQPPTAAEAAAALNPGPVLGQAQLDQILAPIALYPDQLLMQVLMAATFPQQVAAAGQWLQTPANAALQGDALANALAPLPWDPSVKSLLAFPQIIAMMNAHFGWTEELGLAFGSEQAATMAQVQFLRARAAAAGRLVSTAQIRVVHQGPVIIIEPANPAMIYVPVYNPAVIYGRWPYPSDPPVYVPPPPGFVPGGFALGAAIGFSIGFGIVHPLWGWGHPDWRRHEMIVDPGRFNHITSTAHVAGNHVRLQGNTWHRTAPVMPVPAASRPHPPAAQPSPHPPGTIAPGGVRGPTARPGALPAHPGAPGVHPAAPHPGAPPPHPGAPGVHAAPPHPVTRPAVPHPAPPHPVARPTPPRPAPHPVARPAPPHPAPHPVARPAPPRPAPHPVARPVARPAPPRPAPRPVARPAPPRPAPHPVARPAPPHPAPHPAPHPPEKHEP